MVETEKVAVKDEFVRASSENNEKDLRLSNAALSSAAAGDKAKEMYQDPLL